MLKNKRKRILQRKTEGEAQDSWSPTASTSPVRQILYTDDETKEDLFGSSDDVEFESFHAKRKAKLDSKNERNTYRQLYFRRICLIRMLQVPKIDIKCLWSGGIAINNHVVAAAFVDIRGATIK